MATNLPRAALRRPLRTDMNEPYSVAVIIDGLQHTAQ